MNCFEYIMKIFHQDKEKKKTKRESIAILLSLNSHWPVFIDHFLRKIHKLQRFDCANACLSHLIDNNNRYRTTVFFESFFFPRNWSTVKWWHHFKTFKKFTKHKFVHFGYESHSQPICPIKILEIFWILSSIIIDKIITNISHRLHNVFCEL